MRLVIMTVITFMNAKASLERVDHFFGYDEKNDEGINTNDTDLEIGEIEFKDTFYQWENEVVKKHHEEGEKLKARGKNGEKIDKKGKDKKDKPAEDVQPAEEKKKKKKKKTTMAEGEEEPKKKKKKKVKKPKNDSEADLKESLLSAESSESNASSSSISASNLELASLSLGSLKILRGEFVSVIGRVGSGKSTFLAAILGEIDKVRGSMSRRGSVAYIPQISWLKSATIRENIIF